MGSSIVLPYSSVVQLHWLRVKSTAMGRITSTI